MNNESKTTGLDNLVSTLQRVLSKFEGIDRKMVSLHEELDYVMEELVVSKAEILQTCETIKNLEASHVEGEQLHEKVSSTFENLFSEMSQIVNAAREGLLQRSGPSHATAPVVQESVAESIPEPVVEPAPESVAEPVAESVAEPVDTPAVNELNLEQVQMQPDEPIIEESHPEPEHSTDDNRVSMEEVHRTLREVAKTLVVEDNHPPKKTLPNFGVADESVEKEMIEDEPQQLSPLAELNNLLEDTEKEVTKELVGQSETKTDNDIPIANEPPDLLKETLAKARSFDGIETEDLGQESEGEPSAEMSELLKSIGSTYVAGNPE